MSDTGIICTLIVGAGLASMIFVIVAMGIETILIITQGKAERPTLEYDKRIREMSERLTEEEK